MTIRELHKNIQRNQNIQRNIQRFVSISNLSCKRKKLAVFIRRDISKLLRAEDFIKQQIEEICDRKKIPVEGVFYSKIFLCFNVIA